MAKLQLHITSAYVDLQPQTIVSCKATNPLGAFFLISRDGQRPGLSPKTGGLAECRHEQGESLNPIVKRGELSHSQTYLSKDLS